MAANNKIKLFLLAGIIFMLFFPGITMGQNSATANCFKFKNLAKLSYGQDERQVGLLDEKETLQGPESFWVDEDGLIYILDSVISRINVLGEDGTFLKTIALKIQGNDIAVSPGGQIFIFQQMTGTIHCLDHGGRSAAVLEISQELLKIPRYFRMTEDGLSIFNSDLNEFFLTRSGKSSDGAVEFLTVPKNVAGQGLKIKNNRVVKVTKNIDRTASIDLGQIDRSVPPISAKVDSCAIASIEFLGQDDSERLYFQVESFKSSEPASGVKLSVYVMDLAGKELCRVENIPNNYYTWTTKLLHVTSKGDIYQMLPMPEGVQINVWMRQDCK